jgi:hypothetical protein
MSPPSRTVPLRWFLRTDSTAVVLVVVATGLALAALAIFAFAPWLRLAEPLGGALAGAGLLTLGAAAAILARWGYVRWLAAVGEPRAAVVEPVIRTFNAGGVLRYSFEVDGREVRRSVAVLPGPRVISLAARGSATALVLRSWPRRACLPELYQGHPKRPVEPGPPNRSAPVRVQVG